MAADRPRRALIVAHGQPSDPAPAEAALARLAATVAGHLPGWQVTSATLATPGALADAAAGSVGLVYPMFMAGGWFTKVHLPERLAAVGAGRSQVLEPFGLDPRVQSLTVTIARDALPPGAESMTDILLAAHGSFRSTAPSEVAYAMAALLRQAGLGRVGAGFIDQTPKIVDVARGMSANAICLPFFAAGGGHVTDDLPEALAEAGFSGRVLPPVGLDPRVPALIAASLHQFGDQTTLATL